MREVLLMKVSTGYPVVELNLCQKYYLHGKLLPPHSTFADFEHPPSTVRDSLSSTFSRPQSTFAHPLSTLGLICAKNTTFAVSFYLRILPSPISNIHLRPSVIRFQPSAIHICPSTFGSWLNAFGTGSTKLMLVLRLATPSVDIVRVASCSSSINLVDPVPNASKADGQMRIAGG